MASPSQVASLGPRLTSRCRVTTTPRQATAEGLPETSRDCPETAALAKASGHQATAPGLLRNLAPKKFYRLDFQTRLVPQVVRCLQERGVGTKETLELRFSNLPAIKTCLGHWLK